MRCVGLILLAGGLAACQTTDPGSPAAVASAAADLPADYRQQILARAKAELFDPYSVRDAAISTTPIGGGTALTGTTAIICTRMNAKNRMGAYTGMKVTSYVFKAGQISFSDQQYAALSCAPAVYEPFPELEAGYQAPTAAPRRVARPAT